jgi:hypothetical protein
MYMVLIKKIIKTTYYIILCGSFCTFLLRVTFTQIYINKYVYGRCIICSIIVTIKVIFLQFIISLVPLIPVIHICVRAILAVRLP